jgi:hypothetical protein
MNRAWWRNAILAAAVAALGLIVYLKPGTDATLEHALSAATPEAARTIRVERAGTAPIALEKRGVDWFLTSPLAARASPPQVERVLAIAGAKSAVRLAAIDLARFDLERPALRLTIDGQHFDFGIVNEISREQYVLTGGTVYAVSARYGAALPAGPADLLDRQLLARSEVPEHIELNGFSISREEGKWVSKPPGGDLSQDDLQRWADDWRHASALRVEPYRGGTPAVEVRIRLRDGKALSLGVLSREPEVVLLRPDEKLVYYLSKGAAKRLLSPPGATEDAASKK